MIAARLCRSAAIAVAILAIVDPPVPLPRRARPFVRVLAGTDRASGQEVRQHLAAAGFASSGEHEAAIVATRHAQIRDIPGAPLFVIDPPGPRVSIERALTPSVRGPGHAITIAVTLRGRGVAGRSSELLLEDGGLVVARATHRWPTDDERWLTTMTYLPSEPGAVRLRLRADGATADVLAPPQRGPIRTLVFAPAVTWPAVFVRRALERDAAFSVASLQRATKDAVTKAGAAPATLSRADLEPYDALITATLDLDPTAREAVRWFVEDRGGVAVFVPDRVPDRVEPLFPGLSFQSRVLDAPTTLSVRHGGLIASELALPRGLPPLASTLASDTSGAPIVFGARRGAGVAMITGALDAWRYRDGGGFDEFWRTAILAEAVTAPSRLDVAATPTVVRPGDRVRIEARLRATEIPVGSDEIVLPPATAHAVARGGGVDEPVRLWPTAQPGVYEGEWTAAGVGDYAVDVSIGALNAATVIAVDSSAVPVGATEGTALDAAGLSGGGVFADATSMTSALALRFPASTALIPARPARTVWWAAAFALLLCAEWALRRRQGLP